MDSKIPLTVIRPLFDLKEKLGEFEYQMICGDKDKAARSLEKAYAKMEELWNVLNYSPENRHQSIKERK